MNAVPAAWLNDFLLNYSVGHVLLLAFLLTVPAAYFKTESTQVFALVLALFGTIFAIVPSQAAESYWRFVGYALLLVAPVLWVMAKD